MKIDNGHVCKNCCYYINEEGSTMAYCCLEPLFTEVKPNHPACECYTSDTDDDNFDNYIATNSYYDEDDDEEENNYF